MTEKKIQVHVADDHQILIDGIIALLNTDDEIEVKGASLTGKQVIEWSKNNTADVLVLDINMPEMDGIEVLKVFKARNSKQKTIILSSLDDPKLVQELLKLGANGFIKKAEASNHLQQAIKTVYNNKRYLSNELRNDLFDLYVQKTQNNHQKDASFESLNNKEIDLLRLIAQEKSTSEIAEVMNVSVRTIEHYRSKLIKKINVKNAVGLAMYAVKNNIV